MAITHDQNATPAGTASGTTVAVSFLTNPKPSSTVLVAVAAAGTTLPVSVTDNGINNTFVLDAQSFSTNSFLIYRANNVDMPVSGSYTVTVTYAAATKFSVQAGSFTGVLAGYPTPTTVGSSSQTGVFVGPLVPVVPGCLLFAGFTDASALNPETITLDATTNFIALTTQNNGNLQASATAYRILAASTAAQTCKWTLGDSVAWVSAMVLYQPAPQLAPTVPFFSAGYQPQMGDFDGWWFDNAWFFQNKVVLRARQTQIATSLPAAGTLTQIGIDTIDEDPWGGWGLVSAGFWTPKISGWYTVTGCVMVVSLAAANEMLHASVGGTSSFALCQYVGNQSHATGAEGEKDLYLTAGTDTVGLFANVASASVAVNTSIAAGSQSSMEVIWLSS